MNNIVELYERPHDAKLPVVCMDEKLVELRQEVRPAQRCRRKVLRRDCEYVRHGTANLFMITEPKGDGHYVRVTKRRTAMDFAHCLKWLASRYKDAVTIHLVMDNLNTHREQSLVEAFGPTEGRRLWARFTPHYTPKHGSWLNQAEIAISVTARACLRAPVPSIQYLRTIVTKFWKKRRDSHWRIQWRWTTRHAAEWIRASESRH